MGTPGYHRFPPVGHRYPTGPGSRYPTTGDRYPVRDDHHPASGSQYPYPDDPLRRYPGTGAGGSRIPSGRYPSDRHPDKDLYPTRDRISGAVRNGLYPNGYEDNVRGTKR